MILYDKSNITTAPTDWLKKYLRLVAKLSRCYAIDFEGLDILAKKELSKRKRESRLAMNT